MFTTYWKTSELAALKVHYPKGGADAVMRHIDRNRSSIHHMAHRHKIKGPHTTVVRRLRKVKS